MFSRTSNMRKPETKPMSTSVLVKQRFGILRSKEKLRMILLMVHALLEDLGVASEGPRN